MDITDQLDPKPKRTVQAVRLSFLGEMIEAVERDYKEDCVECLIYHSKLIQDTLMEMQFEMEERLESDA